MADYQLNRTWAQIKAWMDRLWDLDAASGDEINTGTNTTKFVTAKAIEDSDLARMSDLSAGLQGTQGIQGTTGTGTQGTAGESVQGTQGIQGTTGNAETSLQEVRGFALSDETTALTVSQRLGTHWPDRFVIKSLYGSVNTAPSGSAITVDLEIGGSSVLSTGLLQIAAGATTGATDAFASGKSDWTIEQGDWTTFDIDQIGSSIAGAGLKVYLKGYTTGL